MGNPLIYACGASSIIIVISHDVNDIMALIGRATEPQLALHIKHHTAIQKISLELSMKDYKNALSTVNDLLAKNRNIQAHLISKARSSYTDSKITRKPLLVLKKS